MSVKSFPLKGALLCHLMGVGYLLLSFVEIITMPIIASYLLMSITGLGLYSIFRNKNTAEESQFLISPLYFIDYHEMYI